MLSSRIRSCGFTTSFLPGGYGLFSLKRHAINVWNLRVRSLLGLYRCSLLSRNGAFCCGLGFHADAPTFAGQNVFLYTTPFLARRTLDFEAVILPRSFTRANIRACQHTWFGSST